MRYNIVLVIVLFIMGCNSKSNKVSKEDKESITKQCIFNQTILLGESIDTEKFCNCLIPKLYEEFDSEKVKWFVEGEVNKISDEDIEKITTYYEGCYNKSVK